MKVFDGAFYAYEPICAADIIEKGKKAFQFNVLMKYLLIKRLHLLSFGYTCTSKQTQNPHHRKVYASCLY